MNALERIKEIEISHESGQWPIEDKDGVFLLKAFKVMRGICLSRIHGNVIIFNMATKKREGLTPEMQVEREFEKGMSQ